MVKNVFHKYQILKLIHKGVILMYQQTNWLQRLDVIKLIRLYLTYPKYSNRAIADEVGCGKQTVRKYKNAWENDDPIPQLETSDINNLKMINQ